MAETPRVMPSLHMPLQSGSDSVLRSMRRSYRQEKFLGIISRVRAAIPEAAITTDIIVGFPGETEADFEETLNVVREARFAGAFTFQYSRRPGTPAADMPGQVPKQIVQERYERLVALQEEISWAENKAQVGHVVEVLVAEGEGRKDSRTRRMSGRAPDNRLVHFRPDQRDRQQAEAEQPGAQRPDVDRVPRPGDMVTVRITRAAPHHLVADDPVLSVRRTRAGAAWAARDGNGEVCGDDGSPGTTGGRPAVSLGMPTIGPPRVPNATSGC
jgi:tRNA-2-methylthio-N6-dimethylallyladenosine synthase